jgi:hypothetical protein
MADKVDGAGKIPQIAQNAATSNPGDGIRSLRSSTLFRVTNFELYAKPVRRFCFLQKMFG